MNNNFYDETSSMFRLFEDNLRTAAKKHLPNLVSDVETLIKFLKINEKDTNNKLDIGYADLYAWYQSAGPYDCLMTKDQNYEFLFLLKKQGSVNVYEINNFNMKDNVKPTNIEDFETIVAPYLMKKQDRWQSFFEDLNNNPEGGEFGDLFEKCSIEPFIELSYHVNEEGDEITDYRNVITRPGFTCLENIKMLNSMELQIQGSFLKCLELVL